MKKTEKITKYIVFKNDIKEVTSIGIDDSYEYKSDEVLGEFIVSGIVKESSFGNPKGNFSEIYNFDYKFDNNVSNIDAEIIDFTYDIIDNRIKIEIEYSISYDEIENSIEELLNDDNIEVIDFRDEEIKETKKEEPVILEPERDLSDDDFIMYHVYVVNINDSFESISNKYNISIENIKLYNEISELKPGIKLIIPCSND